jgi:hypothetical protein
MKTMIDAALAAGRIVVIPTIPWGRTANLQANVPTLNAVIEQLYSEYPQIIHGPDLYTYFNNNQSLISNDNIHPTDPAGYTAYRTQWVNAMEPVIYSVPTLSATPTAGTYTSAQSVVLTATKNAAIYYTTNGATPTTSSTLYSSPIAISNTTTLKAVAVDQAGNQSDIAGGIYTINAASSGGGSTTGNSSPQTTSPSASNTGKKATTLSVAVTTTPQPTTTSDTSATSPASDQLVLPAETTNLKEVEVTIKDALGRPLSGVTVTLHSTPQMAITDAQGVAVFANVEPGSHTITVDSGTYRGSKVILVAADAATKTFAFSMTVQQTAGETAHSSATFIWWISGGALIIVILAASGFVAWRRRSNRLQRL